MDTPFMDSVWWAFSELWKKNLIYHGVKVMPYSTKLQTSQFNNNRGCEHRFYKTIILLKNNIKN
ncbi:MAG: class I tRNA ligase family protein [Pseudomonadota bacterium]|nr:class I tRNA ligase family protein [Pseudomonadota bacterium]